MADARRWTDGTGRVRWQPVTGTLAEWTHGWHRDDRYSFPSLYRSRRRAIRVARLQEQYKARTSWTPEPEDAAPPDPPPRQPDLSLKGYIEGGAP